jgi:hypothetical protein
MPGLLSSRLLSSLLNILLLTALLLGLNTLVLADNGSGTSGDADAGNANIANSDVGNAEGFAYSENGDKLLYTEVHRWQGVLHTVEYFRPNGKLVSVNELDSSNSFVSPVYKQHYPEARFAAGNFAEGARWRDSELVLFSGNKEKVVEFQRPLVLSSGFYHFILEHWRELQTGQSIAFDFAVPSRLSTVRLRMHALSGSAAAAAFKDSDPSWFYVRVEVANTLLRWLVKPLTVALDNKQRLVLYHGISNVRDDNGDTPQVLIRYRYPAAALSSNSGPATAADK